MTVAFGNIALAYHCKRDVELVRVSVINIRPVVPKAVNRGSPGWANPCHEVGQVRAKDVQ